MSLRELDALAGLRAGHSRCIENGTYRLVSADVLNKICGVFGVSLDWLYLGEGAGPIKRRVLARVEKARAERPKKVASG